MYIFVLCVLSLHKQTIKILRPISNKEVQNRLKQQFTQHLILYFTNQIHGT